MEQRQGCGGGLWSRAVEQGRCGAVEEGCGAELLWSRVVVEQGCGAGLWSRVAVEWRCGAGVGRAAELWSTDVEQG